MANKCLICNKEFNDTNRQRFDVNRYTDVHFGWCYQCWHDEFQKWEDDNLVPEEHRFTDTKIESLKRKK